MFFLFVCLFVCFCLFAFVCLFASCLFLLVSLFNGLIRLFVCLSCFSVFDKFLFKFCYQRSAGVEFNIVLSPF